MRRSLVNKQTVKNRIEDGICWLCGEQEAQDIGEMCGEEDCGEGEAFDTFCKMLELANECRKELGTGHFSMSLEEYEDTHGWY